MVFKFSIKFKYYHYYENQMFGDHSVILCIIDILFKYSLVFKMKSTKKLIRILRYTYNVRYLITFIII